MCFLSSATAVILPKIHQEPKMNPENPEITRFFNEIQAVLGNQADLQILNNTHGCVLWDGPKVTKNGIEYGYKYIKPPFKRLKSREYTHRLSFMQKTHNYQLPRPFDVSHLCHNSLCINPNHLALEPHHINNNRIHCINSNRCFGHAPYKNCLLH